MAFTPSVQGSNLDILPPLSWRIQWKPRANRQTYIKIGNNVALLKFQQLLGTVRRFDFCSYSTIKMSTAITVRRFDFCSCCTIKMLFFMLKVYSTGKQCRFLSNLPWISLEMPSTTADSLCVWESTAPTEQLMTCISCNWWTKTKIFNWCGGGIDLH